MLLMLASFMQMHYVIKFSGEDKGVVTIIALVVTVALLSICVLSCFEYAALLS